MQHPGPRRSPATGGYARGGEKRSRIVEAALREFGEHGYERTSTRRIAALAGVNPPALQYYFESKEGLHIACAEHIAQRLLADLEPSYACAEAVTCDAPPGEAVEALCAIMEALAEFLLGAAERSGWSGFLARGQGEDSGPAYAFLKSRVSRDLHGRCARLVAHATASDVSSPLTRLRTIAVLGQLSVFHLSRTSALAMLEWEDFGGGRLGMLKDMLRFDTRALLLGGSLCKGGPPP